MAFTALSLDDSHRFGIALHRNLMTDPDVSPGSFNWLWLRVLAGGVTENHAHLKITKADLLPDKAEGDILDRWANILGVARKSATPARKDSALRVFGTPAAAIPDGSVLTSAGGLSFAIDGAEVVGVDGYFDCNIVAIDVGSQTRLGADEQLTFESTPAGLVETAELQLDMDEDGVDQETDGDLRVRVLARLSTPPLGGAQEDYVQWALEEVGVSSAYCYPIRGGLGTVDVVALHKGSGETRVLLSGERTALQAALDAKRPVTVKDFRVLEVTTRAVDVEYTILPDGDAETEFDWDDTVLPEVLAWDGPSKTLQFAADRPDTMKVGDRLSLDTETGNGAELIIESFSGTDSVVLEEAPSVAPVITNTVYAGGPLVEPTRVAIQAMFDALGTANPDDRRYGTWDGNVRPGSIDRAGRSIEGVLDGTVVSPSAIEVASDPVFPDDESIELLIAGRILVHRSH